MTPQDIRSSPFTATSGATTLAGQMSIAQYTTPSPTVDATFKTVNGKVDELLNIAKAYGVSAVEGMSGSGAITLDVHAAGPIKNTDAMTFTGTGAIQNASLKMPSLTQPLNVRNANLQFTQNSVNLTNLAASLGSTNASGNLSVANFQAPRLTFALAVDKLNITELQKMMVSAKPAPAKKAEASWSLIPAADAAPAPQPSFLDTATGTGTITVGSLVYDRTTLTNVHSNVNLNHGVIQLNPLTGQVFGGQINGSITADLRHETSSFAVNAKLSGADANQLLTAVANTKDSVYGSLNATMNQTFSTPASGDVAQTLNGPFSFTLTNGRLAKLDLLNELGKIGKFGGGGKGYTAISSMSGTFDVRNGVANTNDLKAALDVGSMAATGTINLVNEALAMHLTAVLDKSFSQSVGGTGVGGYLNTALGNKNGELVLPVIISGTMSHPVVAPDAAEDRSDEAEQPRAFGSGIAGRQGWKCRWHSGLSAGRTVAATGATGREARAANPAATIAGCARGLTRWQQEEAAKIDRCRVSRIMKAAHKGGFFSCQTIDCGSYVPVASSRPCSTFSWHSMQWRVHGTASSRLGLISVPQAIHSPNVPSRMRSSALSTICKVWRSLLLWLNRNSLV